MDFETLDWELEAQRVAWAFEVKTACKFRQKIKGSSERRILLSCGSNKVSIHDNLELYVTYKPQSLWFKLEDRNGPLDLTWVLLDFNGNPLETGSTKNSDLLAKGLCRLGLLTPEIEVALESRVSAHQKLEWMLEHEARYGL